MAAEVRLRCDAVIDGTPCEESIVLVATSAAVARDDAVDRGWVSRRSAGGRSTGGVKDFCPRCAPIFARTRVKT